MTDLDEFRRHLESGVENEITANAEELARNVVASVWNAVDDHLAPYIENAAHHRRSAEHITAKRDLVEVVLGEWETGGLEPVTALEMIRSALAVGPVKTRAELGGAS